LRGVACVGWQIEFAARPINISGYPHGTMSTFRGKADIEVTVLCAIDGLRGLSVSQPFCTQLSQQPKSRQLQG
jgi:hypothetical protein